MTAGRDAAALDFSRPQAARRYDAWLGGKDNFAVDRWSADDLAGAFPSMPVAIAENRAWMRRSVRYLAEECGIRQFLDIGTGTPYPPNVHEIAQAVDPRARVVYVDNDRLVAVHARALLTGTVEGATEFVDGDVRDPQRILAGARKTLDFDQPVALLLIAVLHFVPTGAHEAVQQLVQALPAGSYVALTHATFDPPMPAETAARLTEKVNSGEHGEFQPRTRAQVAQFLDELETVPPGLVSPIAWRPDLFPNPATTVANVSAYAAVAKTPTTDS